MTLGAAMALLVGCSSEATRPDAAPVHVPGGPSPATTTSSDPAPHAQSGPSSAIVTTGPVRVSVRMRARSGPAGDALRTFILERTRSIIAGDATPRLRKVSSAAEYARQRLVIGDAAQRGLTVPTRPLAVVVRAQRRRDDRILLGVCLWLPSTEFVDEVTGVSPAGPVPPEWLAAVAHASKQPMTWVVDRLTSPRTAFVPDCGGLS